MVPHLEHTETAIVVAVSANCFLMCIGQETKRETPDKSCFSLNENISIIYVSLELTFAGRYSLKPLVVNKFVVGTSTVLKPSTAGSATTGSARFLERAAFGARLRYR